MTWGKEQNLELEAGFAGTEETKEKVRERERGGMVGEDADVDGDNKGECQIPNVRKTFWRSVSWSSSRSAPTSPAGCNYANGQSSFRLPAEVPNIANRGPPLTPRSQQLSKVRSALPPLQPLSIARRSLDEWPKAGSDDIGEWLTPATPREKKDASYLRNGAEMRLDLCSVQRNAAPTELQVKREKFAFFDKDCSRVADHIYLGSDAVARNREILEENGITHVLNCVGFVCPEYFKKDLTYKTLWLQDSPCEDITSILYDVFDYFEEVSEQGGRVFVHCYQGVSRSTSLVIAYLMWRKGQSFEDAFQYVKSQRGTTNPNMGFACQLLQCQKRVHAAPLSPNSVLRLYRMAPHSPYDPLHLVPKIINNPSPAALDSRGAFIVHVPSAIYVWIGQCCEGTISSAAKASASQVVRYERAQGPVIPVYEGKENPEFWNALSKTPIHLDKPGMGTQEAEELLKVHAEEFRLSAGNKRVESYDVDFELFRRATVGGVVPPVPSSGAVSETRLPARENGWGILRRQFEAGNMKELAVASSNTVSRAEMQKDIEPAKQDIKLSSMDLSTSSSSPQSSPSSISSDSKFSSKSPSPSPSSLPFTPSSSSSVSWSPSFSSHSQSPVPDSMETFERSVNPSQISTKTFPSKVSPVSLAQRRGSVSPSLQVPVLGNNSFLGSRVLLKGIQVHPAVDERETVWKEGSQNSGAQYDLPHEPCGRSCYEREDRGLDSCNSRFPKFGLNTDGTWEGNSVSPVGVMINTCIEDNKSPCPIKSEQKNSCKWTRPMLYDWPKIESIDMFDADDLDSSSVFLLLVPRQGHEDPHYLEEVYVWVGCDLVADKQRNGLSSINDGGEIREVYWTQIGRQFLEQMALKKDTPITVVKEGEEPDKFWANFVSG